MRQMRTGHRILVAITDDNLGDLDVEGRVIIKWILKSI
jgi:hypothetical protein